MLFPSIPSRGLRRLLALAAVSFYSFFPGIETAAEPAPLENALDMLDQRSDWRTWRDIDFPRHPAEKFLENWVIVIDPGHGGDAHRRGFKRGPTGVREADINWRVAVLLERLLTEAGAHITLTRTGDTDVSLADRAEIANTVARPDGGFGADLFISLHHNATSNPQTNYTSIWHHGQIDWSEPEIDVARYAAHSLFRYLRTDAALTSYLLSDQLMYPRGFGVLNRTDVPAILFESSFHSNPQEEKRLQDAHYNLREAYAIYVALCEYAYGGRPTQSVPETVLKDGEIRILTRIDDGLPKHWWGSERNRTVSSTVQVYFKDEPIPATYDPAAKTVEATLPVSVNSLGAEEQAHILRIHHANFAKHHNWPQRYRLHLSQTGGEIKTRTEILGAQRAGREPATLALVDKPAELSEENPEEAKPSEPIAIVSEAASIHEAKPGDIIQLDESLARKLPVLPTRITAEPSPQLVFSDAPEYFRSGDGVALEENVEPGTVRLYVYHVPEPTGNPKVITALLQNRSEEPLSLRFHRYAFSRPGGHYHRIGKNALIDFFEGKPGPESRTVAPGEWIAVDPAMDASIVRNGDLVHGFYEFEIDQPARILTLQRDPDMANSEAAETLPRLPQVLPGERRSGAGRGLFPISNFLVTRAADAPIDTADGPARFILADGRRDPWITGIDGIADEISENRGNYGALYRIRLKLKSSDGRSHAIVMHNLFGETGPCSTLASAVQVRLADSEPQTVPVPRESVGFKGGGQAVLLAVLSPPENGTETVEILFSPPGASCLPTPILVLPIEPAD